MAFHTDPPTVDGGYRGEAQS